MDQIYPVVIAQTELPCPPLSDTEKQRLMLNAQRLIRKLYQDGVPFFTKAIFHDLARQFDQAAAGSSNSVRITDLNNTQHEFPIETGNVYPYHSAPDDCIYISTNPRLLYYTAGQLTALRDTSSFSPPRAYLTMEIVHSTEIKNVLTNLIVTPWPTTSLSVVLSRFNRDRETWEASEYCRRLIAALSSASIPHQVRNVVAFACSSMNWKDDDNLSSHIQHALVLAIRDFFAQRASSSIDCFAQDPIYTEVDKKVLHKVGITVLDDPRAFLQVEDHSVVISVSPDIPLRQIIADIARPSILLWDKVSQNEEEDTPEADPVSSRVKAMIRDEYTEIPIPEDDENLHDLALYIRK